MCCRQKSTPDKKYAHFIAIAADAFATQGKI